MAEIYVLPLPAATVGETRTETTLLRAVEAGIELGARGHHIRALGHSLENTVQMLGQAMVDLSAGAGPQSAEWQSVQASLDQLTRLIERLTSACHAFPA